MGSFLNQCCVSGQIIKNGYLIPIIVQRDFTVVKLKQSDGTELYQRPLAEAIYAQEPFTPLGFIFTGTYDDYGRYDIDWKTNTEMFVSFLKYLQEDVLITKKGKNEVHDHPFNFDNVFDLEHIIESYEDGGLDLATKFCDLQELINKGRIYLKSHHKNDAIELRFAVIEQIAGDEIEANGVEYLSNPDNVYFSTEEDREKYIKKLTTTPEEVLDILNKQYSKENSEIEKRAKAYRSFNTLTEVQIKKLASSSFRKPCKMFLTSNTSVYLDNILYYTPFDGVPFKLETIALLRKLKGIVQGLNIINMGLKPTLYGSQDYSNKTGKMFSKIIANVATKYEELYSSEEWEYNE